MGLVYREIVLRMAIYRKGRDEVSRVSRKQNCLSTLGVEECTPFAEVVANVFTPSDPSRACSQAFFAP